LELLEPSSEWSSGCQDKSWFGDQIVSSGESRINPFYNFAPSIVNLGQFVSKGLCQPANNDLQFHLAQVEHDTSAEGCIGCGTTAGKGHRPNQSCLLFFAAVCPNTKVAVLRKSQKVSCDHFVVGLKLRISVQIVKLTKDDGETNLRTQSWIVQRKMTDKKLEAAH